MRPFPTADQARAWTALARRHEEERAAVVERQFDEWSDLTGGSCAVEQLLERAANAPR